KTGSAEVRLSIDKLGYLIDPTHDVLADVIEHADLAIAPFEQNGLQFTDTQILVGQQSLQHQARPGTLQQFLRTGSVRERMKNQRRQFPHAIGSIRLRIHSIFSSTRLRTP